MPGDQLYAYQVRPACGGQRAACQRNGTGRFFVEVLVHVPRRSSQPVTRGTLRGLAVEGLVHAAP